MATRGLIGIRYQGQDKGVYNHYDSYPDKLGRELLKEFMVLGKEELINIFNKMISVDDESETYLHTISDILDIGRNEETIPYVDYMHFIYNSLSCEYAYIYNLDEYVLEFYVGFQTNSQKDNRYQLEENNEKYKQCAHAMNIPFRCITYENIDKIIKTMDRVRASRMDWSEDEPFVFQSRTHNDDNIENGNISCNIIDMFGFKGLLTNMKLCHNYKQESDSCIIPGYKINDVITNFQLGAKDKEFIKNRYDLLSKIHVQSLCALPLSMWEKIDNDSIDYEELARKIIESNSPITTKQFFINYQTPLNDIDNLYKKEMIKRKAENDADQLNYFIRIYKEAITNLDTQTMKGMISGAKTWIPDTFIVHKVWDTTYYELMLLYSRKNNNIEEKTQADYTIMQYIESLPFSDILIK